MIFIKLIVLLFGGVAASVQKGDDIERSHLDQGGYHKGEMVIVAMCALHIQISKDADFLLVRANSPRSGHKSRDAKARSCKIPTSL